jgi:hypothetical protein
MAVRGIFCPTAAVLCYRCHGPQFRGTHVPPADWPALLEQVPCPDGENESVCDKCHQPVWVRDDVAALHALTRDPRLSGATLRQTGGMCVAVHVPLTDDAIPGEDFLFVVIDEQTPIDIHPAATKYRFVAAAYPDEEAFDSPAAQALESGACLAIDGVVELAKANFRRPVAAG